MMRRVLEASSDEWQPVVRLAEIIAGDGPSRAALESTRRACRRLADEGRLELDYLFHGRVKESWCPSAIAEATADDGRLFSAVIAEKGYMPGARPNHPYWMLAVRRAV